MIPLRHSSIGASVSTKTLKCQINGGSGFPAAVCTDSGKAIRGWKAAPTNSCQRPYIWETTKLSVDWIVRRRYNGHNKIPPPIPVPDGIAQKILQEDR